MVTIFFHFSQYNSIEEMGLKTRRISKFFSFIKTSYSFGTPHHLGAHLMKISWSIFSCDITYEFSINENWSMKRFMIASIETKLILTISFFFFLEQ